MGGPLRWQVGKIGTLYCVGGPAADTGTYFFLSTSERKLAESTLQPKKIGTAVYGVGGAFLVSRDRHN